VANPIALGPFHDQEPAFVDGDGQRHPRDVARAALGEDTTSVLALRMCADLTWDNEPATSEIP
jgi:hypothetical protein